MVLCREVFYQARHPRILGRCPMELQCKCITVLLLLPSPPVSQDKQYCVSSEGRNLVDVDFAPAEKVSVWNSMSQLMDTSPAETFRTNSAQSFLMW